jgi:hypothetical protein
MNGFGGLAFASSSATLAFSAASSSSGVISHLSFSGGRALLVAEDVTFAWIIFAEAQVSGMMD